MLALRGAITPLTTEFQVPSSEKNHEISFDDGQALPRLQQRLIMGRLLITSL
jgi:hypothetical protein